MTTIGGPPQPPAGLPSVAMAQRPRRVRREASRTAPARGPRRGARWGLLAAPLILLALGLAIAATRGPAPAPALGTLQPEHTLHQFGTVRMQDGLLTAAFPLAVDGEVDAVDLTTS